MGQIYDESLLLAEFKELIRNGYRFKRLSFSCLSGTWRASAADMDIVLRGKLLAYLNPVIANDDMGPGERSRPLGTRSGPVRVIDRPDLQLELFEEQRA